MTDLADKIEAADWYWCGYPGHLIVASSCRFHLHTRIGRVIVSTVGDYWPYGDKGKRETIGCDRYFETYVFLALDTERPEGVPLTYGAIDTDAANDSEESERQHYAMCKKWASAEQQAVAAALRAKGGADAG